MDFIFDQFVEVTEETGKKNYISLASIEVIIPKSIDTCDIWLKNNCYIAGAKIPARVLVEMIGQKRREAQKMLFRK